MFDKFGNLYFLVFNFLSFINYLLPIALHAGVSSITVNQRGGNESTMDSPLINNLPWRSTGGGRDWLGFVEHSAQYRVRGLLFLKEEFHLFSSFSSFIKGEREETGHQDKF